MSNLFVPAAAFAAGLAVGWLFRSQGQTKKHHEEAAGVTNAVEANDAKKLAENAKKSKGRGEHKMVLVVRTDLKMGAGKIAAQCGHATLGAYKHAMKRNAGDVKSWSRTGQAKIALKCPTLEEMHAIADNAEKAGIINYTVVDAGRTQIEEGTETVLAIGPASKEDIDKLTGHLKLL